jgi:hypothetical protein
MKVSFSPALEVTYENSRCSIDSDTSSISSKLEDVMNQLEDFKFEEKQQSKSKRRGILFVELKRRLSE